MSTPNRCRCGRDATGSVGAVRSCVSCVATILGWEPTDKRLRGRVMFMLKDGSWELGLKQWAPDALLERERERVR